MAYNEDEDKWKKCEPQKRFTSLAMASKLTEGPSIPRDKFMMEGFLDVLTAAMVSRIPEILK